MSTAANKENLFSNRHIVLPAMALILFSIGCSGAKDEPGSEPDLDLDADGHIAQQAGGVDCNDDSVETWTYDQEGNILVHSIDSDGNGTFSRVTTYTTASSCS